MVNDLLLFSLCLKILGACCSVVSVLLVSTPALPAYKILCPERHRLYSGRAINCELPSNPASFCLLLSKKTSRYHGV